MPMRTPRSNSPKVYCSSGEMVSAADYDAQLRDNVSGHDPIGRGEKPPGPTRTTPSPWAETDQRKPYLPTEDISTPDLDEGVSFRQRIY